LVGNFIGSNPAIYNVGEYRALFATRLILPGLLQGFSPPEWDQHRARYLREVQQHAGDFARKVAAEAGCHAYCDSSPRNALVAEQLAEELPEALFVLMLRHYSGVVQSLSRSGWDFPGTTWRSRAEVWMAAYEGTAALPASRTVAVSYDHLCAGPEAAIGGLRASLDSLGLDSTMMDVNVFAISHAQSEGGARPTLMGNGVLRKRASFDAETWSAEIEAEVAPLVEPVQESLRERWPNYRVPVGWTSRL
jgi:hypothetical protein